MPEANSAPILSRPPTRYPGTALAPAPKTKLPDRLCQRNLAERWGRCQMQADHIIVARTLFNLQRAIITEKGKHLVEPSHSIESPWLGGNAA